ncbi:MAG: hypothetical protein QXT43_00690 [Candidatus Micrarchaeaceae archaeon]
MDSNTVFYLAACSLIAILVAAAASSYGQAAILIVALSILAILLFFIINYADFLLFPLFTILFNIKQVPAKDYYIPKANNAIIKYVNGIYYATGYLTANIYNYVFSVEQVQEGEDALLAEGPSNWERIVQNIGFPFKYNIVHYSEDLQKFRDELEAKRGSLEFQLSREMSATNPSQLTIENLQRRINILQARIDRLSSGERPINALMYIESTAVGVSEKEALDALSAQLEHLKTVFGGFDLSITRVVGRELYLLFQMNYAIPQRQNLELAFTVQK